MSDDTSTIWYDEAAPTPVPAAEAAAFAAQMLRERDKAMAEAAAAGTQLDAAKRQIGDLLHDIQILRERKFGQVPADMLRQADQDRATRSVGRSRTGRCGWSTKTCCGSWPPCGLSSESR